MESSGSCGSALEQTFKCLKQTEQYGGQRERNYKVRIVIANNMKIDRMC
jgi:hypothetical protein